MYTDRSPRAWAAHKRDTLLGQAQNGAGAGGADFTAVTARLLRFPMTRVERVTWGSDARMMEACWHHHVADSKEAACVSL